MNLRMDVHPWKRQFGGGGGGGGGGGLAFASATS